MYAMRPFTCQWCGVTVIDNRKRRRKLQCVNCAVTRQGESVRQLVAHSGPFYDRWRFANLAAAQRMLSSPAPGECP